MVYLVMLGSVGYERLVIAQYLGIEKLNYCASSNMSINDASGAVLVFLIASLASCLPWNPCEDHISMFGLCVPVTT